MELEIAANIRLPTSESEPENNRDSSNKPTKERRRQSGLRTRQRKDYNQMHNMGTSGAESEDTKPPEKQKAYKNKTNPNERVEELEARNKALESNLETVEEEKYNLQLNIEIKDMGTDIIIKNDKINTLDEKLQQTIDKLTETTKQLDRGRENKNKKDILILADRYREKIPQRKIDAPERIFTTKHLIKYVEDNPIPNTGQH